MGVRKYIKDGFRKVNRHYPIVLILFIYRLLWGFALYLFVESIVEPLLQRYPEKGLSDAAHIYLAEAQFEILKTDITHRYLWIFLGLFIVRMCLTPVLNAWIYYTLGKSDSLSAAPAADHNKFSSYIGSFSIYYLIQMLLTLAPIYWVIPKVRQIISTQPSLDAMALHLMPYTLGCLVYGYVLYLVFIHIQFGRIAEHSLLHSLKLIIRRMFPVAGVSVILLLLTVFTAFVVISMSMLWAGLLALILHQASQLVRTYYRIWGISAQYQIISDPIQGE